MKPDEVGAWYPCPCCEGDGGSAFPFVVDHLALEEAIQRAGNADDWKTRISALNDAIAEVFVPVVGPAPKVGAKP